MHTAETHPLVRPGGSRVDAWSPPWWAPAVLPGRWTGLALVVVGGLVDTALRDQDAEFASSQPLLRVVEPNAERSLAAWSPFCRSSSHRPLGCSPRPAEATGQARWVDYERAPAVIFVFLSIDELTSIPEQTTTPLRTALGFGGILTYAWVVLYVPVVATLTLVYLRWIRSLPVVAARPVNVSGLFHVGGAAGVDPVRGALVAAGEKDSWAYTVAVILQETGKMLGALLMLSVLTWWCLSRERRRPPQTIHKWR